MNKFQKHVSEKKLDKKEYILYDSTYMKSQNKTNLS